MKSRTAPVFPASIVPAAAAALLLLACSGESADPNGAMSSGEGVTSTASTGPGAMTWFVSQHAIDLVSQTAAGAALAEAYFDTPRTYVFGSGKASPPRAMRAVTFTAARSFTSSCAGDPPVPGIVDGVRALPAGAGAVLYDDEAWCFTPRSEVDSPQAISESETVAAGAVHGVGLAMLAAPGLDVMSAMPGVGGSGTHADRYLDAGIAGIASAHADVYEIQSQDLQTDASAFVSFVGAAAAQARSAHRGVTVLAGLSTNPSGGPVPTASELCRLVRATRDAVDGYWLNMPVQGPKCPGCGPDPGAGIAVELLRLLETSDCDGSGT